MKFTYKWLKEFLDIRVSPYSLAKSLTMAGFEVVSLEKTDNDFVFELEITSNRSDLLSVLGIAREVGAIFGKKACFKNLLIDRFIRQNWSKKDRENFKLKIENRKDCPLYTARIIENVKVTDSPAWLKRRLEAVGLRSVNSIVDITNYVQLSLGQPLHAFDLDKLEGRSIFVRRAKDSEQITTIDGKTFCINRDILVIADEKKPIAIAGIMGSKDTEVSFETKSILLESAKFNPVVIRRMRQQLGLSSESQYRFERDVEINNIIFASDYAVKLIINYCKGQLLLSKSTSFYPPKKRTVIFNMENVKKILGGSPSQNKIKMILKNLGFKITAIMKKKLKVEVPIFRKDIKEEIDLIEEIARLWGYDKIPLSLPYIKPALKANNYQKVLLKIENILLSQGFCEVINYSLVSREILKKMKLELEKVNAVTITNPLSSQQEILRPLLLPGLLFNVSKNIRYKEGVLLFEIGRVFPDLKETNFLGLALSGKKIFLKDSGKAEDTFTILHLKGVIELLFKNLGIKEFDFVEEIFPYLEVGMKIIILAQDVGYLGKLDPEVADSFDINKKDVFVAELDLDLLIKYVDLNRKFIPLPIYPVVRRDISLIIREAVLLKEIIKAVKNKGFSLLKEIKVIDFYKGSHIPSGFKGITLSCFYYSPTHTLTEEEINSEHLKICEFLKQEFSVDFR